MQDPHLPSDGGPTVTKTTSRSPPFSPSVDEGRFLPGTVLARRYHIVNLLGRGGMGEVYRATDLLLGSQVALKFLPATMCGEAALSRFRGEVRIARQVSHPNVCRVYDIGEADGLVFLSMEYVDGEDLASLLRRIGSLSHDKALNIARKLCVGLAAAHGKGVIHRDLKPANVMLDAQGEVRIMDFGLATIADPIAPAAAGGGTPGYMAPEQIAGQPGSEQSDIYALGLVLFEIFAGKRPFKAPNLEAFLVKQKEGPPSLSSMVNDVDPAVERAIARCLDPNPRKRPQSALAVSAALPGGEDTPARWMIDRFAFETSPSPHHRVALMVGIAAVTILTVYWLTRPSTRDNTPIGIDIPRPPAVRPLAPDYPGNRPPKKAPIDTRLPSSFRVVRSMVGPSGRLEGSKFVLNESRNRFIYPVDKSLKVYFEWEARPGKHVLSAVWRQPDGQLGSVSPEVSIVANTKELACYWTYNLHPSMMPGIWVVEIRIDGLPAGSHWFEIVGTGSTM
jgi:serine/threonine protein kinase